MKILVTGATGFIGEAVLQKLKDDRHKNIVALVRELSDKLCPEIPQIITGDLGSKTDYSEALNNVDIIIHSAARAHIMDDAVADPLTEFRKVNTDGTLTLAHQAVTSGVKRFIFISSIKVNGEETQPNNSFRPDDIFTSTDPYGISKQEAEQGLLALAKVTGLEVVIIRPPLVYGPGVRANFAAMMQWVEKGRPLPLKSIKNQRSLIALDNLVSFIIHCINHPKAANEVFLVSDNEDVSTPELLQKVAKALNKKARLLPVPIFMMSFAAKLIGKGAVMNRLFGSLQIDSSKARNLLGWEPVISMDDQLKKTADAYLYEKTV